MKRLNDIEIAAQMEDMKSFDEPMPSVGSFSFDPAQKSLINVRKMEITPNMIEDAREKGIQVIEFPAQQGNDSVLGGSVRWNTDNFEIQVDHWAEPILDELTELLEKEFALPYLEANHKQHYLEH